MGRKIGFLMVALSMVGCAAEVAPDATVAGSNATLDSVLRDDEDVTVLEPGAGEPKALLEVALPFEVLGKPGAGVTACQDVQFDVPEHDGEPCPNHGPIGLSATPVGEQRCQSDSGGMLALEIAENSLTGLRIYPPGGFARMLQVRTGDAPGTLRPLRLLDDASQVEAYRALSLEMDPERTTVVVETPADGASVELLVGKRDPGPAPLYLDASGAPTQGEGSVAGGWAVFPNVPQGIHEVLMGHDALDCTADPAASWPGANPGNALLVTVADALVHSNVFDCR